MLKLSQKTSINRSKLYRICDKLEKEGIIKITKSATSSFAEIAEAKNIKEKVENIKQTAKELDEILPEVINFISSENEVSLNDIKIRSYPDYQSIVDRLSSLVQSEEEIYITAPHSLIKFFREDSLFKWIEILCSSKAKLFQITNLQNSGEDESIENLLRLKFPNLNNHLKTKFLSREKKEFTETTIIRKKSVLQINSQRAATEIINQSSASTQLYSTQILWESIAQRPAQIIKSF